MSVSRETQERLDVFAEMLRRWNPRINLVGPGTLATLETRHIADSLQLLDIYRPDRGTWADLGSGGGLPAIPVACALAGRDVRFTLLESDRRKAVFLRQVAERLDLPITVENRRIEAAAPLDADTVSARALAPLPCLLSYVHRHLGAQGTALLLKGQSWRDEVDEARGTWAFDMNVHPSATSAEGVVLELRNLRAA